MERKIKEKVGQTLVPISWVYRGEGDTDTAELKGAMLIPGYKGKLGLSQAPGKNIPLGRDGKKHSRDLVSDVHSFKERGVDAIFCLLNKYELRSIGVDSSKYEKACESEGIDLTMFAIIEMGVPGKDELETFKEKVIKKALEYLKSGKHVLIHCRGGIGRASTVAACVIGNLYKGVKPEAVIKMLRRRRDKKAVESYRQEQFIKKYFKELWIDDTIKR